MDSSLDSLKFIMSISLKICGEIPKLSIMSTFIDLFSTEILTAFKSRSIDNEGKEIGSRVGRNQTTIRRICDSWMQKGTKSRRGRSHPPQCTTSLSARTIRRRLQQSGLSASRPLLGLPLTQNHRCLRRQWCDERRMWVAEWNEVVFTDESRISLQHHDARIRI
ncbi:transposable element Tcb1 transposase [Trichonephila clavipes]|nr:transposable element Tcb1 transposase [Trichonephila clavipes]